MQKAALFTAISLCATGYAGSVAASDAFYGYAYDLKTGKYIYTEVHNPIIQNGKETTGTINYYDANGGLIAKKSLDYRNDYFVPTFKMELLRQGYVEGIRANGAEVVMFKVGGKGEAEETKAITKTQPMAADSGFNHYLQANLNTLASGKKVTFKFAVAGQLDSYKFKAQKTGDTVFEGRPALALVVKPDSLLGLVAPDLNVVYDPASNKLLEYRGISNMHDPATGKAYNARIVYSSKPPADAPRNLPPLP